jgi:antitoxin HicB
MTQVRTLESYLGLPYTIELIRQDEETWFARVAELPGCMTEADSAEEAAVMIQEAMADWIAVALEDGQPVPEPRPAEEYSGKFVLRVSKSLHRDLAEAANRDGISLNQYLNVELARAVGRAPVLAESATQAHERWPGLQAPLRRVLARAGYRQQAEALDERLFADWLSMGLAQASAAIEIQDFVGALSYLDGLMLSLQTAVDESPLLGSISAAVQTMYGQIETICHLRERIIDQPSIQTRISQHTSRSNRFAAQAVMRDDAAEYMVVETPMFLQRRGSYQW